MRTTLVALTCSAITLALAGPQLGAALADGLGLDALSSQLTEASSAHAAFIRRAVLKAKPDTGYRAVAIVADDDLNDEVAAVELLIQHVEGQPVPLGGTTVRGDTGSCTSRFITPRKIVRANGNKRFVYSELKFGGDAVGLA